ncbi:type II toxin-antitoxin system RelE/ParE family toxin [Citricoccus muralis]|uniref:Plasmid stabilization system protein ParE n=1 Tax=Citricoccus muralis TaxID=169134 RepID=A0A3D9LF34_9MICC|nr:type II toxin-antitoxin system RelE/ParE family toxin [Citricoccus muralis]REE04460.1 plasmid stabilization system protein ParE [Citricoccus muralis]
MSYTVGFSPEATGHLEELRDYITSRSSPEVADGYIEDILSLCESLTDFPFRGTQRDDIRPGIRTLGFRRRVVIAFRINEKSHQIEVLGAFYGGRDLPAMLD